jgi:hypothetical protein
MRWSPQFWTCLRRLCLAGGILAAAGCDGGFGPADDPAVYLLASVSHTRIDSTVNALEMSGYCGPWRRKPVGGILGKRSRHNQTIA